LGKYWFTLLLFIYIYIIGRGAKDNKRLSEWVGVPPQQEHAPHGHQTTQHIGEKPFLSTLVAALTIYNSIFEEYYFYKSLLLSLAFLAFTIFLILISTYNCS